jgi:hypothetical protein
MLQWCNVVFVCDVNSLGWTKKYYFSCQYLIDDSEEFAGIDEWSLLVSVLD